MEGTKHPPPSNRILEVKRAFEWSRLEGELMTSAYEYIMSAGRSDRAKSLPTDHQAGGNRAAGSDGGWRGYATGA